MTNPLEPFGGNPPSRAQPGSYHSYSAGYPPPRATNSMAVVSLVCAFLFAPLGILFGHMSLSEIKRTGEEGRGLAIAALVISYLVLAFAVFVVVLGVLLLVLVDQDHADGPAYWSAHHLVQAAEVTR